MDDPGRQPLLSRLAWTWWIAWPRWAGRRSGALRVLLADGHFLNAFPRAAALLPPLAGLVGLAVGWRLDWRSLVFTESLGLVFLFLVVGLVSTHLGAWLVSGYVVGDFFLRHTSWKFTGWGWDVLNDGLLAHLARERVPMLIEYILIIGLAVGVPLLARALAASVVRHLPPPESLRLTAAAVLAPVAAFVLTYFWASAVIAAIRPRFTWSRAGSSPTVSAIATVQENAILIARIAAVVMLARIIVIVLLGLVQAARRRMAAVEIELTAQDPEPPAPRRAGQALAGAVVAATTAVLLMAGIITDLWVAGVVFTVTLLAVLAKLGMVPFPPPRWRDFMSRIPMAARFAFGMVLLNGISRAIVEARPQDSLQILVLPIVTGILVLLLLLPEGPPRVETEPASPQGAI